MPTAEHWRMEIHKKMKITLNPISPISSSYIFCGCLRVLYLEVNCICNSVSYLFYLTFCHVHFSQVVKTHANIANSCKLIHCVTAS